MIEHCTPFSELECLRAKRVDMLSLPDTDGKEVSHSPSSLFYDMHLYQTFDLESHCHGENVNDSLLEKFNTNSSHLINKTP